MIIRNLLVPRISEAMNRKSFVALKQREQAKKRRKAIFGTKFANASVYAGVFLLIVSMIYLGYDKPNNSSTVSNATSVEAVHSIEQPSVDEVIAANVAAGVAQTTDLPVASSISSLAISVETLASISTLDTLSVLKPQIIESVVESRHVQNYTTVTGDTVPLLAEKFGITAQTIKWANNLTSDNLAVGNVLKILPIDGVLYTVSGGDTIESIAKKYKSDETRIITYNDLEVAGITPSTNIILPDGILPETERPGYTPPVVRSNFSYGVGFSGQTWFIQYGTGSCPTYAFGNCTCYAYSRRIELGLPVGSHWGHAASWDASARQAGYSVSNVPSKGAIIQNYGGLGHVGIVEHIAENGDIKISEMNARVSGGGYNIVSGRTIYAGNVSQYNYIH